jgi:hypothetical protein
MLVLRPVFRLVGEVGCDRRRAERSGRTILTGNPLEGPGRRLCGDQRVMGYAGWLWGVQVGTVRNLVFYKYLLL